MGSYLLFRLVDRSPDHVEEVNEWLQEQPEYAELAEDDRAFSFWEPADRQWVIDEHGKKYLSLYCDIGEGKFKVNGMSIAEANRYRRLWAALFDKLHDEYEIEVYSESCAFGVDYFSREQVVMITDDGDALTGAYTTLPELFEQMDGIDTTAATEVSA